MSASFTAATCAKASAIESVKLNDKAVCMPVVGWGTWKVREQAVIDRLLPAAFRIGYRHIDSAAVYENEKQLGKAFRKAIEEEKIVKREEVFVTSKLWNTEHDQAEDWQLEYFDGYLIHWPAAFERKPGEPLESVLGADKHPVVNSKTTLEDTWRQMESLVDKGLVRSIGVSNFGIKYLKRILAICRIPPAVNQEELLKFCKEHGITVVAYSPLGAGKLPVTDDPTIKHIAEREKLTPAQVCIAWAITQGCPAIPKTANEGRLGENYEAARRKLSEQSMKEIRGIREARLGRGEPFPARAIDLSELWGLQCFPDE